MPEDTDADSTLKVKLDSIISSSNAHRESSGSMIRIQCAAAAAPQVRGTGQGDDTAQRGRDLVRGHQLGQYHRRWDTWDVPHYPQLKWINLTSPSTGTHSSSTDEMFRKQFPLYPGYGGLWHCLDAGAAEVILRSPMTLTLTSSTDKCLLLDFD